MNFDKNCQRQAAIDQNEYGNERGTANCTLWHYAGHKSLIYVLHKPTDKGCHMTEIEIGEIQRVAISSVLWDNNTHIHTTLH